MQEKSSDKLKIFFHKYSGSVVLERRVDASIAVNLTVPSSCQMPKVAECLFDHYSTVASPMLWHGFPALLNQSMGHISLTQ